jgi:hypothetical protein
VLNKDRQNKALQQNRDDVLRSGESVGCDLLKAAVLPQEAQSQSQSHDAIAPISNAFLRFLAGALGWVQQKPLRAAIA